MSLDTSIITTSITVLGGIVVAAIGVLNHRTSRRAEDAAKAAARQTATSNGRTAGEMVETIRFELLELRKDTSRLTSHLLEHVTDQEAHPRTTWVIKEDT